MERLKVRHIKEMFLGILAALLSIWLLSIWLLSSCHDHDTLLPSRIPVGPCMGSRIVVCMWYDHGIASYADHNREHNERYCKKNGYDFIVSHHRRTTRHAMWERFPLMLEVADTGHYGCIVWIDADACFMEGARPLLSILEEHPEAELIFSADIEDSCFHDGKDCRIGEAEHVNVNSGIFFMRTTPFALEFIRHTLENGHDSPNDQSSIRHLLRVDAGSRRRSFVYPYGRLQIFGKAKPEIDATGHPLIWHLAGESNELREAVSLAYGIKPT